MKRRTYCVAMLLAGGQGSRLYSLTTDVAKPAVTFGGKYKIIDFPLSNCVNSYIDTIGVLTQYQPLKLNQYIGNGQPWDLDRNFGGAHILPPYQKKVNTDWYRGTANAIYQNLPFIDQYDPEYVLILSGDHIYKMDYNKMIAVHRKNNADCTIAVLNVSLEEASRFGIMNTNPDGSIYEFEEKPKQPKSTKASMGIYLFNYSVLKKYLSEDDADPKSSNDFGKNIIPNMLKDGLKLYTYDFEGYWKDVGTLDSLWEANMDLLGANPKFNLNDEKWKIYSRNDAYPPQLIKEGAILENSTITEGCVIEGTVINSVLSNNVRVEKGAVVKDCVIFDDVLVEAGAKVEYAIVDSGVTIKKNVKVGAAKEAGAKLTVIAGGLTVKSDVANGTMLEEEN